MSCETTIDSRGCVAIPEAIRERLGLRPGDSIQIDASESQLVITPLKTAGAQDAHYGIHVHHSDQPLPDEIITETIEALREERLRSLAG